MPWPPAAMPTNRTNADPQQDTHPADHNSIGLAVNDIVTQVLANIVRLDFLDGRQNILYAEIKPLAQTIGVTTDGAGQAAVFYPAGTFNTAFQTVALAANNEFEDPANWIDIKVYGQAGDAFQLRAAQRNTATPIASRAVVVSYIACGARL